MLASKASAARPSMALRAAGARSRVVSCNALLSFLQPKSTDAEGFYSFKVKVRTLCL